MLCGILLPGTADEHEVTDNRAASQPYISSKNLIGRAKLLQILLNLFINHIFNVFEIDDKIG